jgi:hypothetical protein
MTEILINNTSDRVKLLHTLNATEVPYRVKISKGRRRSLQQNAYLWGVCYATILEQAGEALAGWKANDLHEYFLGEHFGWETLEGMGRKRVKPLRRSSVLNKMEFVDFVASIQQRAAEMGIVISDPETDESP